MSKKIIVAITGASGSIYGVEFLKLMQKMDAEVHGLISNAGQLVLKHELGLYTEDLHEYVEQWDVIDNFAAPMSSGSSRFDAMVVLPCTMGTLGAIANGIVKNLIHRAADVILKEKRPLLLAVRETPFNRIHLENMLKAHDAGATVCPPMPSFYHHPQTLEEMASFYAARVADLLGFPVEGLKRWRGLDEQ